MKYYYVLLTTYSLMMMMLLLTMTSFPFLQLNAQVPAEEFGITPTCL
jgi:hypothetical protein